MLVLARRAPHGGGWTAVRKLLRLLRLLGLFWLLRLPWPCGYLRPDVALALHWHGICQICCTQAWWLAAGGWRQWAVVGRRRSAVVCWSSGGAPWPRAASGGGSRLEGCWSGRWLCGVIALAHGRPWPGQEHLSGNKCALERHCGRERPAHSLNCATQALGSMLTSRRRG